MLLVALTGGIATGKSVVAKTLEDRGCYIHRADQIAHELMKPQKPSWKKIVTHFGPDILHPDQTIDRAKLGAIVFADEKERRFLNELIHPQVLEETRRAINRRKKEGQYKIFISEAALTIEAGYASVFDRIIVVYCRDEIQIQRLMERDGIRREEAQNKIRAQMPSADKLNAADYTIDTSFTMKHTIRQTEQVYQRLLDDYEFKKRGENKKD